MANATEQPCDKLQLQMAPVDYLDIVRRGIKSACLRLSPKVLRDHRAIDTLY